MTIYAISIATNLDRVKNTKIALKALEELGTCQISPIYEIPCRDGVGADYWNCACLLTSTLGVDDIHTYLKDLEQKTGRKRPSHQISLDMDLIAWGEYLDQMQFNPKKLPLAQDVIIPMLSIWQLDDFNINDEYPIINL